MNKKQKTEEKILKEIEGGRFSDCYLVYNRKSTDEADNQKNSISYQKSENTRFTARGCLPIASVTLAGFCIDGIISEKHSGFKEDEALFFSKDGMVQYRIDRPKFQQMVQLVNAGYFKGIVCLCWDRISRNKGDDTIVRKLMRKGVDIRFVYANYDKSSAGELHMDIDSMFAVHHSRVTSEKVTISTRNSREKGKCTYRAPIGYLNTGSMDYKPMDPLRGPIIADMFKLYATGDWSLSDIAGWANEQGFSTVPMRPRRTKAEILADGDEEAPAEREKVSKPIDENGVSRILTNQFYMGKVLGPDGLFIESTSHEALVDNNTFNQVQALLGRKRVSVHYAEKLDHPLRGMIRCAHCNRVYTPYTKKGHLYFNARCVKGCENTMKNCSFDRIAERIRGLLENLYFTDDELAKLDARTSTGISLLEEKRKKGFEQIERKKKTIREQLAYLRTNRLSLLTSGAYTPENIVEEQDNLKAELDKLIENEEVSETAMADLMKDITTLSELIKNAVPVYDNANQREKERIVKVIFSELFVSQNTLEYKAKKGFKPFVDRISAFCDPIAWLSELCRVRAWVKQAVVNLKDVVR